MEINKIREKMLGHFKYKFSLVIITPLKSTYRRLSERLNIKESYVNTFFENCVFRIKENKKLGILVFSPQGIAAKDVIELFNDKDILFFGLAGSLSKKLKIGSFVEVENVVDEEEKEIKLVTTGEFDTVKCGYSPCLLGTIAKKHCDLARKMKCDVVDMETVYCAKTAVEKNNRFKSILLISDIPEMINFWEVSEQAQNELRECRILAVDKILNIIDILERKG